MRADNTSVVIIMLDPPGPPKRDVLKTCSLQQYSLDYLSHADVDDEHTEELRTETGIGGDGNGDNFTMFDHRTNEHIDLDDMPMPTSGLAIMTRAYDHPPSVVNDFVTADKHQTYHVHHVTGDASSSMSTNAEVPYMNSFAESYNSLLNSSLEHDQSYIYHRGESEDEDYDEDSGDGSNHFTTMQHQQAMSIDTYRLTKLQTRSEQQNNYFAAVQQQPPSTMDAYRLHHPPQPIQHYQTMSSTSYAIPCATTSNFRLATAMADQPLPAMESILHNLHNSTSYYSDSQKVLIDPNDITIISNCSDADESHSAVAVAVECLTENNYAFQPNYEPELDEEISTVDLTISPATIEDLSELEHEVIDADDSIQINEISSSEAMDEEIIADESEPLPLPPLTSSPAAASPPPPKSTTPISVEVPLERIMTRSSQAQPAAVSSPRITRSTDRRAITKQSEKKRRQVALKAKIDAIISKRSSTATTTSDQSVSTNKFHKENISNVRKLRKNLVVTELASVTQTRTRNASIRIPSPATIATSTAAASQRTLRSQNTVTKDKTQQMSTSRTDHHSNDVASATSTSSKQPNSSSNSSSNSSKQTKRLTDAVQIVKNDATKLKNVQQFLTTRQLRDAKLVALNNVSTIRCKMMLAKKSMTVLPSRCSNGSSFLGDVERTMITRRTRLHH